MRVASQPYLFANKSREIFLIVDYSRTHTWVCTREKNSVNFYGIVNKFKDLFRDRKEEDKINFIFQNGKCDRCYLLLHLESLDCDFK